MDGWGSREVSGGGSLKEMKNKASMHGLVREIESEWAAVQQVPIFIFLFRFRFLSLGGSGE